MFAAGLCMYDGCIWTFWISMALTWLQEVWKAWRNVENLPPLPERLFFFLFGWKRDGTPGETWKHISCRKAVSNGNVINFHFISSAGVNTWTRVAPWEPSIQMQAEKKGDCLHAFWLVSAQNSTYKWKLVPSFCKPHFLSALGVLLRPVPR